MVHAPLHEQILTLHFPSEAHPGKPLEEWSAQEVQQWMNDNYPQLADQFPLTGAQIATLSEEQICDSTSPTVRGLSHALYNQLQEKKRSAVQRSQDYSSTLGISSSSTPFSLQGSLLPRSSTSSFYIFTNFAWFRARGLHFVYIQNRHRFSPWDIITQGHATTARSGGHRAVFPV